MKLVSFLFEYKGKLRLQSSYSDIGNLINFSKCLGVEHLHVTDIVNGVTCSEAFHKMGIMSSDYEIFKKNSVVLSKNKYPLRKSSDFLDEVKLFVGNDPTVIYYSGHLVKSGILLPDESILPVEEFHEVFRSCSEIFLVVDACHSEILDFKDRDPGTYLGIFPCKTDEIIISSIHNSFTKNVFPIILEKSKMLKDKLCSFIVSGEDFSFFSYSN